MHIYRDVKLVTKHEYRVRIYEYVSPNNRVVNPSPATRPDSTIDTALI